MSALQGSDSPKHMHKKAMTEEGVGNQSYVPDAAVLVCTHWSLCWHRHI